MKSELKTAACYIRVSTNKQEELSPDSQLKEIKKWAKQEGYIISNEFVFMENEGISGRRADKRQEFQRMIAIAKTKPKPFDAIIVWKYSRFARNQDESVFYKSLLRKKLGIDVISISEPILEGMYGRLIEMIIEWFDEFYSINLSGEVLRGMKEKASRGGYQCTAPYGYKHNPITKVPDIVPEQAAVVKTIYELFLSGKTYCDVASHLNALGMRTRQGKKWELRTIQYVLTNPFYCGKIRWNRLNHETRQIKDKSEWIIADGAHEPVISAECFEAVQVMVERRAATYRPKARAASGKKHWLSGMVKCSNCGTSLFVGSQSASGAYFQCGGYIKGKCRVSHHITEAKLTTALIEGLRFILDNNLWPTEYTQVCKAKYDNEYSFYETALQKLENKQRRIKTAYADGIDSLDEYRENKRLLKEERERLDSQYAELVKEKKTVIDFPLEINNIINLLSGNAENEEKLTALRQVVEHIIYNKEKQELEIILVGVNGLK